MSNTPKDIKGIEGLTSAEHIGPEETGDNINAKRVAGYVFNASTNQWERSTGGVVGDGNSSWGDSSLRNAAGVTNDGELITTVTERERNVMSRFIGLNIAATKWVCLIDLSDTTGFPHDSTGRIDVSYIATSVDRDNLAAGSVAVGVVTRVNGTNADVSFFTRLSFEKSDVQHINHPYNLSPSQIKLGVVDGTTTRFVSNDKELNITAINTGITLDSPLGSSTVTPAVGDVVVKFTVTAGTYDSTIRALYHSQETA